jgi:hypothetical protein
MFIYPFVGCIFVETKTLKTMENYNFTYYGTTIQRSRFEDNVPKDWESEYDSLKGYSWGGYDANKVDNNEED